MHTYLISESDTIIWREHVSIDAKHSDDHPNQEKNQGW